MFFRGSEGGEARTALADVRPQFMNNERSAANQTPIAILAGGLGTRLRPLTDRLPKALVMVCGKPFLQYQLNWLASHGLRDVVLCVGYRAKQIESFVKDGRAFGVRVRYSCEDDKLLGTAGALKRAETLLGEEFCVMNGDSYLPINPLDSIQHFKRERFVAMMVVFRNRNRYDSSNATVKDGVVTAYSRDRQRPELEFIDYGMRMFRKEVLQLIAADDFCDLDMLYGMLIEQGKLSAYVVREPFYEVGSVRGLARFRRYVEKTKLYQQ